MAGESTTTSVTQAFEQLRQGDIAAIETIWHKYLPRLLALARKTMNGRLSRISDADDAVQSAFLSFWRRAERGDFTGDWNRNDLWNLMAKITVRKSLNQVRHERAAQRGGGRVVGEEAFGADDSDGPGLDHALEQMPVQEFDLRVEELLNMLDDELREFAMLRMMDYKNREIAELLDCTERKVERKLEKIRAIWQSVLDLS